MVKKNVNWNIEKIDEMRINIITKSGYKTQLLLSVSMAKKIEVFYFSDEAETIDCMNKVKATIVEKKVE